MSERFRHIASGASEAVGSPWAFCLALAIVIGWAMSGPIFGFSDTWQLVINTGTTIVTFLMVFLIQNTQNRDARATHVKLDDIISSLPGSNRMIGAEDLPDAELAAELRRRRAEAQEAP